MNRVETTVFELAGPDRPGLLAEVTHLLTHNGCNIRSAAVGAGQRPCCVTHCCHLACAANCPMRSGC